MKKVIIKKLEDFKTEKPFDFDSSEVAVNWEKGEVFPVYMGREPVTTTLNTVGRMRIAVDKDENILAVFYPLFNTTDGLHLESVKTLQKSYNLYHELKKKEWFND